MPTTNPTLVPRSRPSGTPITLPDASALQRVGDERIGELVFAIQRLSLARRVEDVQDVVKRAARQLARADGATFVLRDGELCFYVDEDAVSPLWKGHRFPMDACISGWAMRHREAVALRDVYADPRIPQEAYRPTFVRSLLMTPIRRLDPLGAIGVYWAEEHDVSDEERALLQALADSTAVAVESARLWERLEERVRERTAELAATNTALAAEVAERRRAEEALRALSLTDELTGLHNRRGFLALAAPATASEPRTGDRALLVFVDVDGLKAVNDTCGHAGGDAVIRAAADVLRHCFRESDVVARVGGDEFAVYVPHTADHPGAIAGRIESAVGRLNDTGALPARLSLSVGVSEMRPGATLEERLAAADRAMYRRKHRRPGRQTA